MSFFDTVKPYIVNQLKLLQEEPGIFLATAGFGFLAGQLLQLTWILVPVSIYFIIRLYKRYVQN